MPLCCVTELTYNFIYWTGCPYACLADGPISQRLSSVDNRLQLLLYLVTELQALRMVAVSKPQLLAGKSTPQQTSVSLQFCIVSYSRYFYEPTGIIPVCLSVCDCALWLNDSSYIHCEQLNRNCPPRSTILQPQWPILRVEIYPLSDTSYTESVWRYELELHPSNTSLQLSTPCIDPIPQTSHP